MQISLEWEAMKQELVVAKLDYTKQLEGKLQQGQMFNRY